MNPWTLTINGMQVFYSATFLYLNELSRHPYVSRYLEGIYTKVKGKF